MDKLLIISCDNHAGARAADYVAYFEPEYREAAQMAVTEEADFLSVTAPFSRFPAEALEAIDHRGAIRAGGEDGSWDMARRLKEMDDEGVAAEIVYAGCQNQLSPFFTHVGRAHPGELRSAGARAHHRWFVDFRAPAKDRVFGVADPGGCLDMAGAVTELNWCADHGFVAIGCPGAIKDEALPPLYDPCFEPFWKACVDRGLVLSLHVGWGRAQGAFFEMRKRVDADPALSAMLAKGDIDGFLTRMRQMQPQSVDIAPRRAFWQLVLGGVFDRYPTLKIAFAEVHSDWIPDTLDFLDQRFEHDRGAARLRPSDYFRRQGHVTPTSPRPSEIAQRDRIGIERMMLGIDYPHPEGTWPNSHEWLGDVLAGLSEYEVRRFCGENALDCFALDRTHLKALAARIGPDIGRIMGEAPRVDPRVIAHFDARAGYSRPAEAVDRDVLEAAVAADLAQRSAQTATHA